MSEKDRPDWLPESVTRKVRFDFSAVEDGMYVHGGRSCDYCDAEATNLAIYKSGTWLTLHTAWCDDCTAKAQQGAP